MSASWFSISKSTLIVILTKLKTVFDTKADSSHTHTKSDITDFAHDHPLSIEAASTATSAINLDPNAIYKLTAGGKTFIFKTPADSDHYAWADITGKPSSYPPSAHTHTVSQITDFPSTMPPSSHTHGNIQNSGTLQTNDVAIANGDKLVITDSSDSSKIARASIAFDGSTATKCLTQKGTWETFLSSHQDISGKVNKTGDSMSGTLCMNSSKDNFGEGIRINAGANGYSTLTIGTESNSTNGISDKSFWIGTNRTNASYARKLYIAHNASAGSITLFYAESSSQVSPYLQIGSRLDIKGSTVGANTYADTNPKLRFLNNDSSQNISLTFTDYDSVQSPASLTLNGNQGGEYFIAPNIKATGKFYGALQGNADTATKLATARNIALNANFSGGANFDGSANITINSDFYSCAVNSGNKANYPWHRIAYCSGKTGQYTDVEAVFDISQTYNGGGYGRIKVTLRTNSNGNVVEVGARWIYRVGYAQDSIKIAYWGTTGQSVYADIFLKCGTYARTNVQQVRGKRAWTLVDSNEVDNTTASDPKTSTECWATIEAAGTALHNQAYTNIVAAWDVATVEYANSAGSVAWSNVTNPPASYTPSSHTHGNIQNGGTLQTNDITIASGDKLVVTDSSDSSKIARASISFDGSTATKCLTQKGTWATFLSSHQDISGKLDKSGGTMTGTLTTRSDNNNGDVIPTTEGTGSIGLASKRYASVYTNSLKLGKLGNSLGSISMYNTTSGAEVYLSASGITGERIMSFPDKSGTIALTSDIVDTKVTQTNTTTNASYEVLLSESSVSNSGTLTEGARKSKYFYYNPGAVALYLKNPADTTSFWFSSNSGTGTSAVAADFTIGNSTASGTAGNRYGILTLFSKQSYYAEIRTADTYTASRSFYLPNKGGTIALTSDIPNVPDFTLTAMKTITKVNNAYYTFNGNNGEHYGYYKYGRIVVAVWNVYCSTATEAATQKIGTGFPKPAASNGVTFALGSQNVNRGSAIGIIDGNGDAFAMGGCNTNVSYYYGICTYIT